MKHAIGAVKTIANASKFDSGLTTKLNWCLVRIPFIGPTRDGLRTDPSNRKIPCIATRPGYARVDEFRETVTTAADKNFPNEDQPMNVGDRESDVLGVTM
jgi:hypothetical protein